MLFFPPLSSLTCTLTVHTHTHMLANRHMHTHTLPFELCTPRPAPPPHPVCSLQTGGVGKSHFRHQHPPPPPDGQRNRGNIPDVPCILETFPRQSLLAQQSAIPSPQPPPLPRSLHPENSLSHEYLRGRGDGGQGVGRRMPGWRVEGGRGVAGGRLWKAKCSLSLH